VDGIIWDLDGTLLDSFGIFERVVADVVRESGHVMPTHASMLRNFHGVKSPKFAALCLRPLLI
jgi:phosphoglycolate phosphatase-like HAD superfamily hydrolase